MNLTDQRKQIEETKVTGEDVARITKLCGIRNTVITADTLMLIKHSIWLSRQKAPEAPIDQNLFTNQNKITTDE